jgi:hypothetical protein
MMTVSNPTLQSLYDRMAPWPDAQGSPTAGVHDAAGHTTLTLLKNVGGHRLVLTRYRQVPPAFRCNYPNAELQIATEHWHPEQCLDSMSDLIRGLEPHFHLKPGRD